MQCRLFRIEGRVQGVWFRESTRRQAIARGLTGYAKNLADGSVEVLACGVPAALDQLADWLRQGPPMAQVTSVDWSGVNANAQNHSLKSMAARWSCRLVYPSPLHCRTLPQSGVRPWPFPFKSAFCPTAR
jgi:acylphosphatase